MKLSSQNSEKIGLRQENGPGDLMLHRGQVI